MVGGTGAAFSGLAVLPCPLYYLEHPTLHAGESVQALQLPQHYAGVIQAECLLTRWTTFDIIGASFGGWLVCAAKHKHTISLTTQLPQAHVHSHVHIQALWFRSLCCRHIGLHSAQGRTGLHLARSPSWTHRHRW